MTPTPMSKIEEDAAAWVARMDGDSWSEAQEDQLQKWLAADSRRPGALLEAQAIWVALDDPNGADELSSESDNEEALSRKPVFSRRIVLAGGATAIAASLAGVLLLGEGTRYTTEVGEIRRVPLADGSFASINTGSSVEVDLAGRQRDVRITRGEAWFQVAKDPERPFIVEAGRIRVRAVGTAFSVRRRDGGADILVTEGVVEAWANGAEGNRIRLSGGQRAYVADNAEIRPEPAAPSAIDRTLAWRSGKIDLVGETVSDAAVEFNRYNHRQIVVADPAIGAEQFDGVFGTNDPQGFAVTVRDSLSVPVDFSDPAIIRIGGSAH